MEPRIDFKKIPSQVYKSLMGLEEAVHASGLDRSLIDLVKLRASQINGCAYCIDMHWKDLRAIGEPEQRLYGLDAWRESPYYTDRERAALMWAEAVTLVAGGQVDDLVYESVKLQFTEKELAGLTCVVASINVWNRLAISGRTEPGLYVSELT